MFKQIIVIISFITLFLNISCKNNPESAGEKEAETITDFDGNVYKTVKIGEQLWMVENLKVRHYRNGDEIPNIKDAANWAQLTTGACCAYNNEEKNVSVYGLLYNWFAVKDSRKIAPAGWHVPADEEFKILENYLIENGYNWDGTSSLNKIGKSLASKTNWSASSNAGDVGNDMTNNNTSGFTALPGGSRSGPGSFGRALISGIWWSASEYKETTAIVRSLYYNMPDFERGMGDKKSGFSVRLVHD